MLLPITINSRIRRLADRGIEALVAGVNHLRFHHEIRHPDNANMWSNYRSLRDRQVDLRADLDAMMSACICPEDLSVRTIIAELDQVAHAIAMLREDALEARPQRLLREIMQTAAS